MKKHSVYCLAFFLLAGFVFAKENNTQETNANKIIKQLYHRLNKNLPISQKIAIISEQFLDKPYLLSPLGEGKNGYYNQNPLYRTDAFDCTTYVSTVLALAKANNLREFKSNILKVRYKNAKPKFTERNHFMSADWNINNQKKGYIKDITASITDRKGNSVAIKAQTIINKPQWYKRQKISQIVLTQKENKEKRLQELKKEASHLKKEVSEIYYIPINKIIGKKNQENNYILQQIPNGSIVEIVRPGWNLEKQIGTRLHVSHLGFAIHKGNQIYFREASTVKKKVTDVLLVEYLKNYRNSKTIKGINIQKLIDS